MYSHISYRNINTEFILYLGQLKTDSSNKACEHPI